MEQDVGLIVLEHLRDKLCVHVLDVDLLKVLVQHHDGFVQFLLFSILVRVPTLFTLGCNSQH